MLTPLFFSLSFLPRGMFSRGRKCPLLIFWLWEVLCIPRGRVVCGGNSNWGCTQPWFGNRCSTFQRCLSVRRVERGWEWWCVRAWIRNCVCTCVFVACVCWRWEEPRAGRRVPAQPAGWLMLPAQQPRGSSCWRCSLSGLARLAESQVRPPCRRRSQDSSAQGLARVLLLGLGGRSH